MSDAGGAAREEDTSKHRNLATPLTAAMC